MEYSRWKVGEMCLKILHKPSGSNAPKSATALEICSLWHQNSRTFVTKVQTDIVITLILHNYLFTLRPQSSLEPQLHHKCFTSRRGTPKLQDLGFSVKVRFQGNRPFTTNGLAC